MSAFDAALLLREYGDEALVRDLAELVVSTVPAQIAAVRTAIDGRDAAVVRATVHKLRGSIASFGMAKTVDTARELELMAAAGDLSKADSLGNELLADARSLCESAKAWLGDAAPSC